MVHVGKVCVGAGSHTCAASQPTAGQDRLGPAVHAWLDASIGPSQPLQASGLHDQACVIRGHAPKHNLSNPLPCALCLAGGYDVIMENFTKACQSILTVSCLESRGADACVQAAIDAARNKTAPQGGGPSTGVIVGAVIGGEWRHHTNNHSRVCWHVVSHFSWHFLATGWSTSASTQWPSGVG